MTNLKQSKKFGTLSEQKFIVETMERGLEVLSPVGEHLPIDCVVMNRAGGMVRTQIKATYTKITSNGAERYGISAGQGTSKKPIDCAKVDVVACFVDPFSKWYLIPCLELCENTRLWFYPHNPESKGKYEKYKDNWGIFNSKY
jgi:hypothetical protein